MKWMFIIPIMITKAVYIAVFWEQIVCLQNIPYEPWFTAFFFLASCKNLNGMHNQKVLVAIVWHTDAIYFYKVLFFHIIKHEIFLTELDPKDSHDSWQNRLKYQLLHHHYTKVCLFSSI